MLGTIISLVFSKLGGLLALGLAGLGFFLNLKWQKRKRAQAEARADGLEAQVEHQQAVAEVDRATQKVEEQIHEEAQGDSGLTEYFRDGKLHNDGAGGSS